MGAQAIEYVGAAPSPLAAVDEPAEPAAVADRLLYAALGAIDILAIALGDRLGYYRLLAHREALTPPALAAASGTAPRYAREWLEQQAVSGFVEVLDPGQEPDARGYRLRPGVAEVLAGPDELTYLAPLARQLAAAARQLAAAARQLPALAQARRRGRGVPWAAHGTDMRPRPVALLSPAPMAAIRPS